MMRCNTGFAMLLVLLYTSSFSLWADDAISLKAVMEKTLDEHPDVMAAYNRMQAEKFSYQQARAGLLPTLDLQSGWGTQRRNSSGTRSSGDEDNFMTRQDLSLNLNQPLFEGHAINNGIEQAMHLYLARRQEWLDMAQNTALSIAEVYFVLQDKRQQQVLAEKNHDLHKETRDQIRQRVEHGLASETDFSQIEGRVARASVNLMISRNNLDDSVSQFFSVTNWLPGKLLPVKNMDKDLPYDSLEEARKLLIMHPQMQAANLEVDAMENAYKVSMASYYPSFNFEVSRSWTRDVDGVESKDDNLQAVLKMSYNLFRGGADKAAISGSAYRMAEQEESREKIRRQINEALELSWSSYHYLKQQMPFLEKHVESSRQTHEAYEQQFFVGQRELLDLLDTANELFQANQAYTTAHYELLSARLKILSATGGLLSWLELSLDDE
ncbi:MAG: TolC family outer membrane protein [Endozoicomonadaceae bacterium]|nr:TolC family outer membrane protein [Endozoicomonadaceae bacterium]